MAHDGMKGKVFGPWKRHTTVIGLRVKSVPKVAVVLAAGVALFFALGTVKAPSTEPLTYAEKSAAISELKDLRDASAAYRERAEASGTDDLQKLDLTDEERRLAREAKERGVPADASNAQIEAMAPSTKDMEKEVFDPLPRALFCIVLPLAAAYIWHVEMGHGWSLDSETRRLARYAARRPRAFVTRRKSYLEED